MTEIETAIMIKNMARETVRRMSAKVKNGKSDAELLRVYDEANKGYDLFPDLTKYGLSKEEEIRAVKLAQQRNRKNIHEIGHERGKRIAEDRDARRAVKNGKSDAELLRVYDEANKGYDLFPDLTKYGLSKEEEIRAVKLAQQRNRKNIHEIGHERGKRIAEDRDARRGK